ncbi:MAG: hypothetical protein V3V08_11280 [Nannocystaceae bacterium]
MTTGATRALHELATGSPFLLWAHYFGPHVPSSTTAGVPTFGDDVAGRYDHEIAALDHEISRLLDLEQAQKKSEYCEFT